MGLKNLFKKWFVGEEIPKPKDPYGLGKTCTECGGWANTYTTVNVRGSFLGKWFCKDHLPR